MAANAVGTKEWREALGDRLGAWIAYQNALVVENNNANKQMLAQTTSYTKQMQQQWASFVDPMVSKFGSGIVQIIERTKSWAQVFTEIEGQLINTFASMVEKMVSKWIVSQIMQLTATQTKVASQTAAEAVGARTQMAIQGTTSLKQIINEAATAAGAAYQAMAGIPIIGPALGAAAAVAAFAAVAAYQGLIASAAGGYDVPSGVSPVTQLHPQEMVLPANLATGIRNMAAQAASGEPGGGFGGGDTHLHLNMGAGADGPSLQRWFDQHGDKITKSLQRQTRRGGSIFATPN
jgi:hypothetical protein